MNDKIVKMIDWEKFWNDFNDWYNDRDEPSWENQKKHIELLIEEQLSHLKT